MRQLFLGAAVAAALLLAAAPARAGKVEVTGVHLCCGMCVKAVAAVLKKVDGVSDANCDQQARTVTFTAKDTATAQTAVKALLAAGFFGKASEDGKALAVDVPAPKKGETADSVVITDVHVCCGACQKAVNGLFKGAKVSFEGSGAQRTVKVEGKALDKADVLETLHKGGFHGNVK